MRVVDASDGGESDQGQIRHPAGDKLGWPSAGTARDHTAKAVIPGAGTRSVAGQEMAEGEISSHPRSFWDEVQAAADRCGEDVWVESLRIEAVDTPVLPSSDVAVGSLDLD